jgi:hypothetical protein
MSTFLRRGFTLFLLLLAAALLHPVDTTAQNLPGWAEPSEQRESRFESRSFDTQENRYQSNRSQREPQSGINAPFPGASTNGNNGGASCGAANPDNGGCQNFCTSNPTADQCVSNCETDPDLSYCDDVRAAVPVDDYLPLLMLAGIAYAALRLRQ